MIRAVIFDLDGTVLNTLDTITYYVNDTLEKLGRPTLTRDDCRRMVGNGARLLLERALAATGGLTPALYNEASALYNGAYNDAPLYLTAPYPGILSLLRALRERGVRVGILSNKPEGATVPLVRQVLGDLVDVVHGGREGIPLKPDPAACLAMAEELGVTPAELLYVGDSEVDIHTGNAARAACTVGVLWGFRDRETLIAAGAEHLVSTPEEILNYL